MRPRMLLLLALCLPVPALAAAPAPGPAPVGAAGPDAEGAFLLSYRVERPHAGLAALQLLVQREDGAGVVASTRDLGARDLPSGASVVEVPFLPGEGPGLYAVSLSADGAPGEPLRFEAGGGAGASARFSFRVPDEPTFLNLTNDAVNADGKVKLPGETVVTRAILADANGVADVDEVRWRADSPEGVFETGPVALDASANATTLALESRHARSPLAAGTHRFTLSAYKDGAPVAAATRTFTVRDVPPTLVSGALPNATLGRDAALEAQAVVADRNGMPGPLEARVYRGSVRAEPAGFAVQMGEPARLADAEGQGRASLALRVAVPANGTAGSYRVSLYANGTFFAALPFDVRPPPAPLDLRVSPRHVTPRLPASWNVEASPGWDLAQAQATVEVRRWDGAPAQGVTATLEPGGILRVRGPADLEAGRYDARLRLDFANGSAGEASWSFEAGPWMSLHLGTPQVEGREARVVVRNDGGLPLRRLVAEVAPDVAHATLLVDGRSLDARAGPHARRSFAGFELAPGASAELVLRLPDGPLRSGLREAEVRVLALPGGAP